MYWIITDDADIVRIKGFFLGILELKAIFWFEIIFENEYIIFVNPEEKVTRDSHFLVLDTI
jgi:hypothetical protein